MGVQMNFKVQSVICHTQIFHMNCSYTAVQNSTHMNLILI